ncbi:response regulator [Candidatus Solincola tengchongensis]|uniref:ATP-binding response regulator n=1 Tax=Candidatus Solincola tengchongensis TaxID=2900693 RepID=UPI00257BB3A4|nr:response regulator [Candidatus Solincola tengchongensis]
MPVVLYIDDSAVERSIVRRLLEGGGFQVFTAEKPEEGLEIAEKVRPDVILLDLHLEGARGCDLAEHLRKMPGLEDVPIVAISASLREEERPGVLENFDGYIQKPVDVDLLPRMVREFMVRGAAEVREEEKSPRSDEGEATEESSGDVREVLETLEKVRSVMSHDLRTPLTVMISYASTVSREKVGELNERQKEMLDLVVQHGFQMDAQITELVKIARETLDRFGYPRRKH